MRRSHIAQRLNVPTELLGSRNHWRGFSGRQDSFNGRTAHTKCGTYLLASSLAAALLDGLFEHPASVFFSCLRRTDNRNSAMPKWFFRNLLNELETSRRPTKMIARAWGSVVLLDYEMREPTLQSLTFHLRGRYNQLALVPAVKQASRQDYRSRATLPAPVQPGV